MNIGYLENRTYKNNQGEDVAYIGGELRAVGLRVTPIALLPFNNKNNKPDAPFFTIMLPKDKSYKGYAQVVGSLWMRQSKDGKRYLSGYIETPITPKGKIYIALFEPTDENSTHKYEVVYSAPKESNSYGGLPVVEETVDSTSYDQNETIPF
ncbi:DUF736 family protein [Campylobacter hyointestinalis]|uniref:Uncharacterized conserved protein n=1 Tax=Campylobacter hyointestinalis subsp. hyointestinalis TaxID=91352 RepID=A0A9W5ET08_CAMHY|nr:DUF736 family protein [Campylobacter hyointestinalis]CUU75251.1 Uncharacterized conserved protein [Campylobacter hyointestinalis subsp. hyointestinalis]CUU82593.1 Uncharacterized conserved protein [Campylobacter hyointestinalis subsp. hyointestinalis]